MTEKNGMQDDLNEKRYAIYSDERRLLIDAEREGSASFDKTLVTLAAGSLGFSLTYIQLLRPSAPTGGSVPLLILSWVFLGLSLMLIMVSFLTSQAACRRQIEICKELLLDERRDTPAKPLRRPLATVTKILNWAALSALAVGLASLAAFAILNIPA